MLTPKQFVDLRHMHDAFHAGARARNYEVWFPKLLDQVEALQANQKILVDALENLLDSVEEYLPDLSRKEEYELLGIAREALNKIKEK